MKHTILIFLIFFTLTSFNNGSGTAFLTCKSDSGRTEFNAELQDIIGVLEKTELRIDDTKMNYSSYESHIIFDPKNGILTMYINDETTNKYPDHKYLKFWAIPSSFKIIKNESGHQVYEFKAIIEGTEPRKNKESHIPKIVLNCKLEYEI
ncbi:hypothetical protein J2X31_002509 [Flavobacterium arsenatis]|uniref:Uncharacterized protein n=1 Tax=Flavobacterium arsenatis TaxID=1484332 RepID=A0ABU1TRI6_9FLAO|nr:hypothetical protein [Flavobacterium arsenatis]MDR6968486.1 hypothetical protein [Flavobacterium arsenatis]